MIRSLLLTVGIAALLILATAKFLPASFYSLTTLIVIAAVLALLRRWRHHSD